MKISFYNPIHYSSEEVMLQGKCISPDLKNIVPVIFDKQEEEPLMSYKGGSGRFVKNNIGKKLLKFPERR